LEAVVQGAEGIRIRLVGQRIKTILDLQGDGIQARGRKAPARERRVSCERIAYGRGFATEISCAPRRDGHGSVEIGKHLRTAARLEGIEEETAVMTIVHFGQVNGAANGSARVVTHARAALRGERIARAEPGGYVVIEKRPAPFVRSAFGNDRHLADATVFGRVIGHVHPNFGEGFDGRNQR